MLSGSDLKAIRENAGISQVDMAAKLNCDRKTVINYEQGYFEPKVSVLLNWLSICKIDIKPLLEQVKNFRNVTAVLLTLSYFGPSIISPIYILSLLLFLLYAVFTSNRNLVSTSAILLALNITGYLLFLTDFRELIYPNIEHEPYVMGVFLIQLSSYCVIFSIFKIKVRRTDITRANFINDKVCDTAHSYILLYFIIIALLALIESTIRVVYPTFDLDIIYQNYRTLTYIGWVFTLSVLCSSLFLSRNTKSERILTRNSNARR
ncbi:hypothetical protein PCIT_b0427 [Pseudoalteromonas citrea]|uniref:HTH cro/C1-type domain-containing protein n=2 Tax=Pseudoalteromonas citrea TaxID=43655 RepID=A0AAD4AEJ8_9GAMM|nr:helix-turn-helix transcriptional regulator [Pseudoalteromonas citrea]KAF7764428.1 hypothetical protein PCIT_b0427 [Pseudoalteromonas citrea]